MLSQFFCILWISLGYFDVMTKSEVHEILENENIQRSLYKRQCDRADIPCDCSYSAGETLVNCSGRNLTSVPKNLPTNTTHLLLQNNNLTVIFSDSFSNMKELCMLDLSYNNISSFAKGALAHLRKLITLDMTMNEFLQFQNLRNVTYGLNNTSIETLKASFLHSPTHFQSIKLMKEDLQNLAGTKLKNLSLDGNQIQRLELNVLTYLPRTLNFLSVQGNDLGNLDLYDLPSYGLEALQSLKAIDISYQCNDYRLLKQNFQLKERNFRQIKRVRRKIVVSNETRWTNSSSCASPNISLASYNLNLSLTNLIARHAALSHCISHWDLGKLRLKYIDISRNNLLRWIGPVIVDSPQHLTHVDLSNNNCYYIGPHFFENLTSITNLVLRGNMLGATLHIENSKFENLVNLSSIDLSLNGLEYIGDYVLKKQTEVQVLNFSRNSLKVWNISIAHMSKLWKIDLSYNQIADLPAHVMNQLDKNANNLQSNVSLFMTNNPLQCTCKQLQFWKWISSSKVHVHLTEYEKCKLENDSTIYLHLFRNPLVMKQYDDMCRSRVILYISIGLVSFVLLLILAVILYTKRWELRYRWYIYRLRRKGYTPIDGQSRDYDFDAFVSYAEKDAGFVRYQMIRKLETEYGCHLCLHERDFRPGEKIASNIISAIHNSNKTIVVLSSAYLKSHWCKYELHMANEEEHYQGRKVVVLLVLEKVKKKELPAEVLEHYRKNTYIELPELEDNMETFWDALRESMS